MFAYLFSQMKQVTPTMLSRMESEREGNLQQTWGYSFSLAQEPTGARPVWVSVVDVEMEGCLVSVNASHQLSTMPVVTMILKR